MCGFVIDVTGPGTEPDSSRLNEALDTIEHRGPDGRRMEIHENIGLAHCRLAILDLTDRGLQPMTHAPSGWRILYNGEIYNFQTLRESLEEEGYEFQTETDTEVLLKGWVEWKRDLFPRLNGMYAVVFVHPPSKQIAAIRDEFGTKPLYWQQDESGFSLASEQKAILSLMDTLPDIDPQGLNEYLTFQNFLSDRTLIDGIRTLEPGVLYEFDGKQPQRKPGRSRILKIRFHNSFDGTREQAVDELRSRLRTAIENHLISDVPVHAYLSGGMDTSTISVLANELSPYQLKTFTIGFDMTGVQGKKACDERPAARVVADAIDSDHYEGVVTADTLEDVLEDLVRHLEEPRVGQSYPNYRAAELASEHGKAVLSGTGGDELFGGYPWRYQTAWRGSDPDKNKTGLYDQWNRLFSERERRAWIPDQQHGDIDFARPRRLFMDWLTSMPYNLKREEEFLNACFHLDTTFFLRGLLHVEDKLGMAYGLESRFPFLDRPLFHFATSIPATWKVNPFNKHQSSDEYRDADNGKRILRDAMETLLPEDIDRRDKQGFSGPYGAWQNGPQSHFIKTRMQTCSMLEKPREQPVHKNRLVDWSTLYVSQFEDIFDEFSSECFGK